MRDVMRFWLERGVDGFRLDALDRLHEGPRAARRPAGHGPPPLPLHPEHATLDHVHSRNAPDIGTGLARSAQAAGDAPARRRGLSPRRRARRRTSSTSTRAFSFELFHAPLGAPTPSRAAIAGRRRPAGRCLGALQPRLPAPARPGRARERAAGRPAAAHAAGHAPSSTRATRSGMPDGPGRRRRWTAPAATASATRCSGSPAAAAASRPARRGCRRPTAPGGNVADQEADPGSLLRLYRRLIALRRELRRRHPRSSTRRPAVVAYERGGDHVVVAEPRRHEPPRFRSGEVVVSTNPVRPANPTICAELVWTFGRVRRGLARGTLGSE